MSSGIEKNGTVPIKALVLLDAKERERLRLQFKDASDSARTGIVATWLLHGVTPSKMATMLSIPESEVQRRYDDAVKQVKEEMESIPEGPLLMGQIVAEGMHRAASDILGKVDKLVDKLLLEEEPNHLVIQSYLKLRLDVLDRSHKSLERLGFVPNFNKIQTSHGGVRTAGRGAGGDVLQQMLSELGDGSEVAVREGAARVIESSVEQ